MKYKNAADVLPDALLREVQKYAAGQTLYFPGGSQRKKWGEASGARQYYTQRNDEIRALYAQKISVEDLAGRYSLSEESIRKILFS